MTEYKILEESKRENMEAAIAAARTDDFKPQGNLVVAGTSDSNFRFFLLVSRNGDA